MNRINDELSIIDGIGTANVFCYGTTADFVLIDTGIFMKTKHLITQLEENGYRLQNLRSIILTHCHCDHIGGVKELLDNSNAQVAAHKDDIPYILQRDVIGGPYREMMIEEQNAMKRLDCVVPRVDVALHGDAEIAELKVISVPGHTPGSIALYSESKKYLFVGDVIRESRRDGLSIGKPEKFNVDTEQVRQDARKILSYDIEYVFLSHGKYYHGEEISILRDLASGFSTNAS